MDYEDYTVPEALLANVYTLEVVHVTDPNTLRETFEIIDRYTRQVLQGSRGIVRTVCDEAPELDQEFCTAFAISELRRKL